VIASTPTRNVGSGGTKGKCGKNPDFTARTDIIDEFLLSGINNLSVINTGPVYPAYRLTRYFCVVYVQQGSSSLYVKGRIQLFPH
jgi:hypothetical protein